MFFPTTCKWYADDIGTVFVPVMEVFDFIPASKKFIGTLKDLLEIQYRHVLSGASHVIDVDVKIRQGLERSVQTIYTWIETVVQDWEQRIAGSVSLFTRTAVSQPPASDSWASTPQLPPSPAPTPTVVVPGNAGPINALPRGESPGAMAPAGTRGTSARRRPNPAPKRVKRAEILPKAVPQTQIPVPIQRARSPQPQARVASHTFRPQRVVLPSQAGPTPTSTAPNLDQRPPYHTSWENPPVTMAGPYGVPYSRPGDVFQHPAMAPTHYAPIHTNHLEVQQYLAPEQAADTITGDAMQHDMDTRPPSTSTISTLYASRLMSTTPRSSLASLTWIRDENRDSSQTLVEAHPPGRCRDMYCPSCSKALPEDVHSPLGMHHPSVSGPPPHHLHAFQTAGRVGPPFTTSPGEVHNFADQVEWGFQGGGIHGQGAGGNNDNLFGGGHGPQEGY